MWVLEELFRLRVYEPPAQAARALSWLGRPIRIADLGGHVGFFGLFMHNLFPDATIVSFEPDPRNVEILRRCVAANGLQQEWEVIEACAGTSAGTVEFQSSFHLSRAGSPADDSLRSIQRRITETFGFLDGTELLASQAREVASCDVFPFLEAADLIKIDIEGGEWAILQDPRFADLRASAVVLEYHPSYQTGSDVGTVKGLLEHAGYETGPPLSAGDAGMVWAWRAGGRTS